MALRAIGDMLDKTTHSSQKGSQEHAIRGPQGGGGYIPTGEKKLPTMGAGVLSTPAPGGYFFLSCL